MKRALETFHAPGDLVIVAGDTVADDDPIVEGREHLFADEPTEPRRRTRRKADDDEPTVDAAGAVIEPTTPDGDQGENPEA